jgi:ribosomal protein L37AE/L43A
MEMENKAFEEQCVFCGSKEILIEDNYNKGIYYCKKCLDKTKRQERAIENGYDVEPLVE